MLFEISTKLVGSYLRLVPRGEVTERSIIALGQQIREACEASNAACVLVDCSEIHGALSAVQLFNTTPHFIANVGPGIRIAYINTPADWVPEDDRFSRNVANNRGGMLEFFESEADAVDWFGL